LAVAYFRIEVEGLHHLPRRGGAIIAANHPSLLDGVLLLVVCPRPVRFLVAESLYCHRFLHGLFRLFGAIPVYRTTTHNGEALRAAVEALRDGELIGIFPEGTIAEGGRMHSIKKGVGLLALKTGVPIIPLGIAGSREAYPQNRCVPTPGRIVLSCGRPMRVAVSPEPHIPEDCVQGVLQGIQWQIRQAMQQAERQWEQEVPANHLKRLQVVCSALVVVPLVQLLWLTAPQRRGSVEAVRVV